MVSKAVIPAAGVGTRFLPASKAQPKEMLPIIDTPTIQYVVEEAVAAGIRDILIVTGRGKQAIEDHFDRNVELERLLEAKGDPATADAMRRLADMAQIHYTRQREPMGLGHAIGCARRFTGDAPFAVLLGDTIVDAAVPAIGQLVRCHETHGGSVVAVERVPREKVSRYGIVDGRPVSDRVYATSGLVEKPDPASSPSDLAVAGRYVLTPAFYEALDRTPPGLNQEVQITDALHRLLASEPVFALELEGRRYDIGDKLDYLKAQVAFGLKREEFREQFGRFLREAVEEERDEG